MVQMDLFEAGELVQIKHFLTCWNEAERTKRLADVKTHGPCKYRGKPSEAGGEER